MHGKVKVILITLSLLFTLTMGMYYAYYICSSLHHHIIDKFLADSLINSEKNIINTAWAQNHDAIESVMMNHSVQWQDSPSFISFLQLVHQQLTNSNIKVLNLYDMQGKKFFSNNLTPLIDNQSKNWYSLLFDRYEPVKSLVDSTNEGIDIAKKGHEYKHSFYDISYVDQNAKMSELSLLQLIIPITYKLNNNEQIEGILEVFVDISTTHKFITTIFMNIIIFMLIILLAIFPSIIIVNRKASRVINEQYEYTRRLEESKSKAEYESQQKSKFLANVSHELRTPLNAIIGFSSIMKDQVIGPLGNSKYLDYANDINQSGTHLLTLINDILDFSKAEAEKLVLDAKPVNISKLLVTSARMVQGRADEAKVKLEINPSSTNVTVSGDQKRIKQVIINLLTNSVKFTPEGGGVTANIIEYQDKKEVVLEIKDTGIGMAAKDIARALSVFGQIDSSLSRRYEGTGLGLPLSKKLVELMGGRFDIISEEGIGTTITCTFKKADVSDIENLDNTFEATDHHNSNNTPNISNAAPINNSLNVPLAETQNTTIPKTTDIPHDVQQAPINTLEVVRPIEKNEIKKDDDNIEFYEVPVEVLNTQLNKSDEKNTQSTTAQPVQSIEVGAITNSNPLEATQKDEGNNFVKPYTEQDLHNLAETSKRIQDNATLKTEGTQS